MIFILVLIVALLSTTRVVDDSKNPEVTLCDEEMLLLEQSEISLSRQTSSTRSSRSSSTISIPEETDVTNISPCTQESLLSEQAQINLSRQSSTRSGRSSFTSIPEETDLTSTYLYSQDTLLSEQAEITVSRQSSTRNARSSSITPIPEETDVVDIGPCSQEMLSLEQAEISYSRQSSTRSARSSSTIPEEGDTATIKPIQLEFPEFWHGVAALARPPIIEEQTVALGTYMGKGKEGWGFKLGKDVFIKIFKKKQIKNMKDFWEEFKVQYIASALSWIYSRDRPQEPTIAYLIPSPVIVHISIDNIDTKYFAFALSFLPRFLDSKSDFIPMEHLELIQGFQDFVNSNADLKIWDDQGYYFQHDCLFMTDTQLHPDRRLLDSECSRPWPGEGLENPKIKSLVINVAFATIVDELKKLGCKL